MLKKGIALLAALVLCVCLLPGTLAEEEQLVAYVNTANKGTLNVRRGMNTNENNIICALDWGTEVNVVTTWANGTWTEIRLRKEGGLVSGFVMSRYLSYTKPTGKTTAKPTAKPGPTPAPSVETLDFASFRQVEPYAVYANPERVSGWVNLRWAPSTAVGVIERCPLYYQLVIIAKNKSWAQAYDPATGAVGFISLKFVKELGYGATLTSTLIDTSDMPD